MAAFRRVVLVAWLFAAAPFAAAEERVDFYGDPLPTGALARLGTIRLRANLTFGNTPYDSTGKELATVLGDNAHFWDAETGRLVRRLEIGDSNVNCVSFSRDGSRFAALGRDSLVIWDTQSWRRVCMVQGLSSSTGFDLTSEGSQLVLANRGSVQLWNVEGGKAEVLWRSGSDFQRARFSPAGDWVLVAEKRRLHRLRADTGEAILAWDAHEEDIFDIDISPDGQLIASVAENGVFHVWEAETGRRVWGVDDRKEERYGSYRESCRFSPEGSALAVSGGGEVRVFDLENQRLRRRFPHEPGRVLRWSPDGKRIAMSQTSLNFGVRICDVASGEEIPKLAGHFAVAEDIHLLPGEETVVTGGLADYRMIHWNLATGEPLARYEDPGVFRVAHIPGTQRVIAAGNFRFAEYNLENGKFHELAEANDPELIRFWWSEVYTNGNHLVAWLQEQHPVPPGGPLRMDVRHFFVTWDLAAGKQLVKLPRAEFGHRCFVSRDGKTLYALNDRSWYQREEGKPSVQMSTRQLVSRPFEEPTAERQKLVWEHSQPAEDGFEVMSIAFSRDNRLALMACGRGGVVVVDLETGKEQQHWPSEAYHRTYTQAAFTRDGNHVLAGPLYYQLWDLNTGELLRTFRTAGPSDVGVLSPTQDLLATGDRMGGLVLWDIATGKPLTKFEGHTGNIQRLVFTADGKRLISSASDCQTLVWSLDPADWPKPERVAGSPAAEDPWKLLGDEDAAVAYAAAAKLIARPEEALKLLGERLQEPIALPANRTYFEEGELRAHRAAHILERIGGEQARAIRRLIEYPELSREGFDPKKQHVDEFGDPLPRGAVLRLGTERYAVNVPVPVMALAPDGSLAVVGPGTDRPGRRPLLGSLRDEDPFMMLEVFDPRTGNKVRHINLPRTYISGLAYSEDGRLLVCSTDKEVHLFNTADWSDRGSWSLKSGIVGMALSPDGTQLFLSLYGGAYGVYETETGTEVSVGKADGTYYDVVAEGGRFILTTLYETSGKIILWDIAEKKWLPVRPTASATARYALSPKGDQYAATTPDRKIEVRRTEDDSLVRTFTNTANEFRGWPGGRLRFTVDGRRLIIPEHGKLNLFEIDSGRVSTVSWVELEQPYCLSADGRFLAQVNLRRLKVWRLGAEGGTNESLVEPKAGEAPRISADGRVLIALRDTQSLALNPHTLEPTTPLPILGAPQLLSASGRFGLFPDSGGARICEIATGSTLWTLSREFVPENPRFSEDERLLLAKVENRGRFVAYDVLTGSPVHEWQNSDVLRGSVFSANGRSLLGRDSRGSTYSLVDVATGEIRLKLDTARLDREVSKRIREPVQFMPDGRLITGGSSPPRFDIRDAASGAVLESIVLEEANYRLQSISPRATSFLTRRADNALLHLHDFLTGQHVAEFQASLADSVEWLDDERHFITKSPADTYMLWDLATLATQRRSGEKDSEFFERLWLDLAGLDIPAAYAASWAFVLAGEEATEFLTAKLSEEKPPAEEEIRALIAQLDDDVFARREAASRELAALGELVIPYLEPFLKRESAPEIRLRAEAVIQTIRLRPSPRTRERVAWITRQISGVPATPVE